MLMEIEVDFDATFGFPPDRVGHYTSGAPYRWVHFAKAKLRHGQGEGERGVDVSRSIKEDTELKCRMERMIQADREENLMAKVGGGDYHL